jgi:hypothetical protein
MKHIKTLIASSVAFAISFVAIYLIISCKVRRNSLLPETRREQGQQGLKVMDGSEVDIEFVKLAAVYTENVSSITDDLFFYNDNMIMVRGVFAMNHFSASSKEYDAFILEKPLSYRTICVFMEGSVGKLIPAVLVINGKNVKILNPGGFPFKDKAKVFCTAISPSS